MVDARIEFGGVRPASTFRSLRWWGQLLGNFWRSPNMATITTTTTLFAVFITFHLFPFILFYFFLSPLPSTKRKFSER
jgi:hypothetical protein